MLNLLCAENSGSWVMPVVLIGMLVLMLAISFFPQRKKKKEAQQMMQSVRVGKKVKTIGGFVGEIVGLDEKNGTMDLNVGTKDAPVIVVLDKAAIYTVLNPDVPVQVQKEVKTDETVVPTAVTADDMEQDAVAAEKSAEKKAKKEAKKKEKAEKKQEAETEKVASEEVAAIEKSSDTEVVAEVVETEDKQ